MSELRAPDPTLDAFWRGDEKINYVVLLGLWPDSDLPSVAHRVQWTSVRDAAHCGGVAPHQVTTQAARWFAVPCRECFPDAPPPGKRALPPWYWPDPHLAWQVQP